MLFTSHCRLETTRYVTVLLLIVIAVNDAGAETFGRNRNENFETTPSVCHQTGSQQFLALFGGHVVFHSGLEDKLVE